MLMIRNVHISLLAVPAGREIPGARCLRRCSSNFDNSSIAFNPAGVAAQPRPKILAIILMVIGSSAG